MQVNRGDVVMVDFPFGEGRGSKIRPAVVAQCDTDNRRLGTAIVVMITKQTAFVGREPRHILIDVLTEAGRSSGLWLQSVVNCSQIATIKSDRVVRRLGCLSESLMEQVSACLREGLGL
ncbi:MAG: type II toxin-antitoxin system PemK/MazF family toxin [Pirellulaceae bacterium]|nr:type II toxin-antitoxin system PemK/MazF family toxin [Pirellulaceae bacterium]